MVLLYARMGDQAAAREWRKAALQLYNQQLIRDPNLRSYSHIRTGLARMESTLLESQGRFREAEPYLRIQVEEGDRFIDSKPSFALYRQTELISNLTRQGRLLEAELAARKALSDALAFGGQDSFFSAWTCELLGRILIDQNRLGEAEAILETAITISTESGLADNSFFIGKIRLALIALLALRGEYAKAVAQFDLAQGCFEDNAYLLNLLVFRPQVLTAMIMGGREAQAMRYIETAYQELYSRIGAETHQTAILKALRGMALGRLGRKDEALSDYAEALPYLKSLPIDTNGDICNVWTVRTVLEGYLDLLADSHRHPTSRPLSIEIADEAFRTAETLRGQSLQTAIAARSARAAVSDDGLRVLTRQAQDAVHQIAVLETNLAEQAAAPPDQRDDALARRLATQLQQLQAAREVILAEIKARFPKYAEQTHPRPLSLSETQSLLSPGEVLLAVYTTASQTLVWSIPSQGPPIFHVVSTGRADLDRAVSHLRAALDCRPQTLGGIPDFNTQIAYQIYHQLLEPVASAWQGAQYLLVVANAPLSRIPLTILPVTAPKATGRTVGLLFENYCSVDWLARHLAISHQTSAAAFAALRRSPAATPGRKAFVGFGDPVFRAEAEGSYEQAFQPQKFHVRDEAIVMQVRGVRLTDFGTLDDAAIASIHLTDLMPLPDTADEIRSIALALKADPTDSVFLGLDAAEGRIKSMALGDRRVIAFATHALVPGDLDGLEEPALALSSAEATGEKEDGLLTMGEIMTLRLDADWIVLSACNTGAGQGAGAEAVSGLGRAFFYAGSRALLVSMWPVETTAAHKLTTGIFSRQQADPSLGRARALQQSILALMDSPGLIDPRTGKVAASYAHPLFWAPFIVYGEAASEDPPAAQ